MRPMLTACAAGPSRGAASPSAGRLGARGLLLALATASLAFGTHAGIFPQSPASAAPPSRAKVARPRTAARAVRPRPKAAAARPAPGTGGPAAQGEGALPIRRPTPLEPAGGPAAPGEAPPPPSQAPGLAPPVPPAPSPGGDGLPRRVRVRDHKGRTAVARVYGRDLEHDEALLLLPSGQLAAARDLVETDEPFVPASMDAIRAELLEGPFAGFEARTSEHYLVLSKASRRFTDDSLKLLEELYRGLIDSLRKRQVPVHESEFPLVAVIFPDEASFRAFKRIDPDVQAYYEIFTNRIYLYEKSERDELAPEVTALRKPQTVAHEGTHQVLQNIGIHPRLAPWPAWLIEGLAEYCASPATTRKGAQWGGIGAVNPIHMATIRDLHDPLSVRFQGSGPGPVGRDPKTPMVEHLVTREELSPTDYTLSWALTHYLATRKLDEFLAFLKSMSQLPPLSTRTPEEHLAAFRAAFGDDLVKLDRSIRTYLSKLKKYDALPYYAVVFEQPIGTQVRRAAMVSQSPSIIREWLESVPSPRGGSPRWDISPHPTRARALIAVERWAQGD